MLISDPEIRNRYLRLRKRRGHSFDLIILDIMMPVKDGISTCIDIRNDYMIPILFLTAKANEYDRHIGFATGCDDYLAKPFSSIELVARVSALIR